MKAPRDRDAAIDLRRIRTWVTEFANYRHSIPEERIRDWIRQFNDDDRDEALAARILDCVEFYSHDQISAAFRSVLRGLDGWDVTQKRRVGKWRFVAYSASAGESGDSMLHKFRQANNLASKRYNELFIHRSDILRSGLGNEDTVVLVDDFVGSGGQVCDAWDAQYGELLADIGRVYLVVVAAYCDGLERIRDEIDLEVVPQHYLIHSDNIFSDDCRHFTTSEKTRLLSYCKKADSKNPKGHGECGLVVVFAHGCPNNSIAVLRAANQKWEGLFRRYN